MSRRSTFVEVVAWVFIVLSGFAVLAGILQNVMIFFLFPDEMWSLAAAEAQQQDMPGAWMFAYIRYFFLAFLLLSAGMLVAAINLLRRREWARKAFIVFMALGIAWNIGGLAWQLAFSSELLSAQHVPPQAADTFAMFHSFMIWISIGTALAFSTLFGWIAWKLARPAIRAEFA